MDRTPYQSKRSSRVRVPFNAVLFHALDTFRLAIPLKGENLSKSGFAAAFDTRNKEPELSETYSRLLESSGNCHVQLEHKVDHLEIPFENVELVRSYYHNRTLILAYAFQNPSPNVGDLVEYMLEEESTNSPRFN